MVQKIDPVMIDATAQADTISALRSMAVPTVRCVVYVVEHTSGTGKGGGNFYWAPNSNEADDNGLVIMPASAPASGRWKRAVDKTNFGVSPEMFGARADGVTNDVAAVNACYTYGSGLVVLGPYSYAINGNIAPNSNSVLRGISMHASRLIVPPGNATRNAIIRSTTGSKTGISIEKVGFVGQWGTYSSELADNGLLTLKYVTGLRISECGFWDSRYFGINVNFCDDVVVERCYFENSCRDMIGVWNAPRAHITNNTLRHNNDDAISWSYPGGLPSVRSQCVVSNNILEDTGAIRTQAASDVIISSNSIFRPKGAGIVLGVIDDGATTGSASSHTVVVCNNSIRDVIDRVWYSQGTQNVNNKIYIDIRSRAIVKDSLSVAPGELYSGTTPDAYGYYYGETSLASSTGPQRSSSGICVANNICRRTLPAAETYSAWGFGPAFSSTGWVDFAVTEPALQGIGVRIQAPWSGVNIDRNRIEGASYGISFALGVNVTAYDRMFRDVAISNNVLRDIRTYGVHWGATTSVSHQGISIRGNDFDMDPMFLHGNRGGSGTWLSQSTPTALNLPYLAGVEVARNTFRNSNQLLVQTSASGYQHVRDNLIFGNAATAGFSTSNAGIGTVPGIGTGEQFWMQFEDSDPASSTYGQSLGANLKSTSSMPSSGCYLEGTVVRTRSSTILGATGSKYINTGWVRLTTGSSHVLNTDWAELHCLTGS